MNAQHPTDNILIDLHTENQRDLPGNAGTTPAGITPFHCHDGFDEVFVGSLRAGPTAAPSLGENNMRYFRWRSTLWRCGRVEGFTMMAERRTRAGGMNRVHKPAMNPIRGTQVGCTLAPAIEDEQLMPDQYGLGDSGTESTRPRQSGQGDDQMNEYDSEVAHPGNGINNSKTTALRPISAIRHRQVEVLGCQRAARPRNEYEKTEEIARCGRQRH
jgi:hypothetical protein